IPFSACLASPVWERRAGIVTVSNSSVPHRHIRDGLINQRTTGTEDRVTGCVVVFLFLRALLHRFGGPVHTVDVHALSFIGTLLRTASAKAKSATNTRR